MRLVCVTLLLVLVSLSYVRGASTKADLCIECVTFMESNLNSLIKIISGVGSLGTCNLLCGMLNETTPVDATCVALCSLIGYQQFWQLFERANLDPFWACQLLETCPVVEDPAANIVAVAVDPPQGVAVNDTGIGEMAYVVYFASGLQKFVNTTIFEDYPAGSYKVVTSFQTYANSTYTSGSYPLIVSLCAGQCGGRSPNAEILAEVESSFQIVSANATNDKLGW